ncbi:MAG: N-acetyl sugar amidotransferase, partial [Candidatus Omnitrophica bacterium]|nr:N-acetyl sugar amidotransferase [Candidatus Omnitrophota bacterium]
RESKDLRIAFLKASTPDIGTPTDIGIANALYSVAAGENIKHLLIGQSFRTEGIAPLEWNYLDGIYLHSVHRQFGKVKLRKWSPLDPGFSLRVRHMVYYTVLKGIKTLPVLYYCNYIRNDVTRFLEQELGWVNTGAHYWDDLYQSLMTYIMRKKFNIDRRIYNYSALVRSRQMTREEALNRVKEPYKIEDPKVIELCIKRLGLTQKEFEEFMVLPPRTFRDYKTSYNLLKLFKVPIKIACKLNMLPSTAYAKYFECG